MGCGLGPEPLCGASHLKVLPFGRLGGTASAIDATTHPDAAAAPATSRGVSNVHLDTLCRQPRRSYFPREVFFFGFGFAGISLPAAAARAFCFFVAMRPPVVVTATVDACTQSVTLEVAASARGCSR